jgi:O-antigen/teichoic acid export membrane protein
MKANAIVRLWAGKERRHLITIMLGRGLQAVTGVVAIRLLTSFLPPEEAGRCFILLSLSDFFALFLISPMGNYINRKTHEWHRNGTIQNNLHLYWLYLLGVALFAFFFLLLLESTVGLGIDITWLWLLALVAGGLLFNTANVTVTTILNMLGNRIWFVIFTLLTLWVGLGLSFFFTSKINTQAEYWLAGVILAQFLIFFLSYRYLTRSLNRSRNEPRPGLPSIPKFSTMLPPFHFAWPLAIVAGLSWVQSQSYRFVLGHFGGLEALGLFAVGYGIAASITIVFESIFDQYYFPIFYKEVSTADLEGRKTSWNRFAAYLFPGALVMTAFIIACAPYLIKLLVAPQFHEAGRFILWGGLAELTRLLARGFSMMAHAEMKTTWLIPASITGAIVALGGVLALAQWDPQGGTGIALTVAGFAMLLHLAIRLHKEVAFNLPWRRIFISIALSAPLLVVLLVYVNPLIGQPTYVQAIMVLVIAGSYLAAVQYLMATRWINSVKIKGGIS